VGAVSGNARVGNRNSWITRFQSIEYIYGFNLDRRALDLLNAITVVPGAVGAWRKPLILELGGFGGDTLAEDTDLTLKIRRAGYQIRYEEEAVAFTEAPEDTRGLAKQRFRWAFGTLQAAWKHRDALFVPKYGIARFRGAAQHLDFSGAAFGALAFRRVGHDRGAVRRQLAHRAGVLSRASSCWSFLPGLLAYGWKAKSPGTWRCCSFSASITAS
jgi:cellulose synthase/poly-beta-1,6-N-acetylglucosamine synthase-like glycosyltransferase